MLAALLLNLPNNKDLGGAGTGGGISRKIVRQAADAIQRAMDSSRVPRRKLGKARAARKTIQKAQAYSDSTILALDKLQSLNAELRKREAEIAQALSQADQDQANREVYLLVLTQIQLINQAIADDEEAILVLLLSG